jgi:DNA polymerase III gamma/tau subunit
MPALYEKWRPRRWEDLVGLDKVTAQIDRLRAHGGLSGRAFFISGASGTGKSSTAKLIAAEVADDWGTTELDGSEVNVAVLDEINAARQSRPFGRGYCWIIDEAHALRGSTITRLLKLTEGLPPWVTIIFTTTAQAKASLFDDQIDAHPLLSRCEQLELPRRDLAKAFAERARMIAQAEGMDGQPLEKYLRLIQDCRNNLREALGRIGGGEMMQ